MGDTTSILATSGIPTEAVPDGPPPDASLLRRYPSLSPDGEFGPLQRRVPRHATPTAGYVHPDRAAAHQDALAQVRQEQARLEARYPSMQDRPGMRPVEPDGRDLARYRTSMPGGGVDQPAAPVSRPAPAAEARPTQPVASSETVVGQLARQQGFSSPAGSTSTTEALPVSDTGEEGESDAL